LIVSFTRVHLKQRCRQTNINISTILVNIKIIAKTLNKSLSCAIF
jgi:hypothetical protein